MMLFTRISVSFTRFPQFVEIMRYLVELAWPYCVKVTEYSYLTLRYLNQLKLPALPQPKRNLRWYKNNIDTIDDATARLILRLPDELSLRILGEWLDRDLTKQSDIRSEIYRYQCIEKRTFLCDRRNKLSHVSDQSLHKSIIVFTDRANNTKLYETEWFDTNIIFENESDKNTMIEVIQGEYFYTNFYPHLNIIRSLGIAFVIIMLTLDAIVRYLEIQFGLFTTLLYLFAQLFLFAKCFTQTHKIGLGYSHKKVLGGY